MPETFSVALLVFLLFIPTSYFLFAWPCLQRRARSPRIRRLQKLAAKVTQQPTSGSRTGASSPQPSRSTSKLDTGTAEQSLQGAHVPSELSSSRARTGSSLRDDVLASDAVTARPRAPAGPPDSPFLPSALHSAPDIYSASVASALGGLASFTRLLSRGRPSRPMLFSHPGGGGPQGSPPPADQHLTPYTPPSSSTHTARPADAAAHHGEVPQAAGAVAATLSSAMRPMTRPGPLASSRPLLRPASSTTRSLSLASVMIHTRAAGGPSHPSIYRSSTSVLNISLKLRTPNRRQGPAGHASTTTATSTTLPHDAAALPHANPQPPTAGTEAADTACTSADPNSFYAVSRALLREVDRALAAATTPTTGNPRSSLPSTSATQPATSATTPTAGYPPTDSDNDSSSLSAMQLLPRPLYCMAAACVPGCVLLLLTVARGRAHAPVNRVATARAARARVRHVPRPPAEPLPAPDGTGTTGPDGTPAAQGAGAAAAAAAAGVVQPSHLDNRLPGVYSHPGGGASGMRTSGARGGALAPRRSDPGIPQQQAAPLPLLASPHQLLLQPVASAAGADQDVTAAGGCIGADRQLQTNRLNRSNRRNRHRHVHAELPSLWCPDDADDSDAGGGEGAGGQLKGTLAQLLAASNLLQPHELNPGVGTPGACGRWEGSSYGDGGSGSNSFWCNEEPGEEAASFEDPAGVVIGEDSCGRVLAWPPAVEVRGGGQEGSGVNGDRSGGGGGGGSAQGRLEGSAGSSVVLLLERGLLQGCGSVRVVVVRADGIHQEGEEEGGEEEDEHEEPRAVLDHTAYLPTGSASVRVEQQSDEDGSGSDGGSSGRGSKGSRAGSGGGEAWRGRAGSASRAPGAEEEEEEEEASEYVPIRYARRHPCNAT